MTRRLLIADEPTGNLDSDNGRVVLALLAELNRETGITILLATHAAEVAAAAASARPAHARRPIRRCGQRLFRQFILRQLLQERARTLTTIAGIALGVGVIVAIQLTNAASVRGF